MAAAALSAGLVVASWLAAADPIDPTLPHQVIVGEPNGPAPMDRLNQSRTGRSKTLLPRRPRVRWRKRVPGKIERNLAVDDRGSIVVSSTSHLSQVDKHGKLAYSLRLGSSFAVTGPVITSNGARLVVTADAEVVSVDATGHILWRRSLPVPGFARPASPLPTSDGGSVVAVNADVFRLEPDGAVRARASAGEEITCLLERSSRLLLVTSSGNVLGWSPPAAASRVGSLGGPPTAGAALIEPRTLVAVVDLRRLVELDLATRTRRVRFGHESLSLLGPPTITRAGETRVSTGDGLLLGHDADGKETLRVALEPGEIADGGASRSATRSSPSVLIDRAGSVGFARPGMDVGVATAAGRLQTADGAACVTPVSLVPAGERAMAVACRSGIVWLVSD